MTPKPPPKYQSYLLRCMETRSGLDSSTWRFSLQATDNGKRTSFADFESLVEYLRAELESGDSMPEHGMNSNAGSIGTLRH